MGLSLNKTKAKPNSKRSSCGAKANKFYITYVCVYAAKDLSFPMVLIFNCQQRELGQNNKLGI